MSHKVYGTARNIWVLLGIEFYINRAFSKYSQPGVGGTQYGVLRVVVDN